MTPLLLLLAVVVALGLGFGWAWLELVVSSRLGWVVAGGLVLLAVIVGAAG